MYVYIFAFIHYPLGNTPIAVCHFLLLVLCIGNVAHGDAPTSWAQAARQCSHTAYHIHSNDTRVRTCIQQRAPTIHAPKRAHTLWSAIHARVSKCLALHARVSRLVHASKPHRSAPRWRRAHASKPHRSDACWRLARTSTPHHTRCITAAALHPRSIPTPLAVRTSARPASAATLPPRRYLNHLAPLPHTRTARGLLPPCQSGLWWSPLWRSW